MSDSSTFSPVLLNLNHGTRNLVQEPKPGRLRSLGYHDLTSGQPGLVIASSTSLQCTDPFSQRGSMAWGSESGSACFE
jgi:hypothetical protein